MKSKIMSMMLVAALALASFSLMGCEPSIQQGPKVTDTDGNVYPSVKIGNQIWMAKNLNVNVPGSVCYGNSSAHCEKYGRLYTWETAKKACPAGWHLPSKDEFEMLLATVGASPKERSKYLRAGSWENGANKFGFSALPAGFYFSDLKKFNYVGYSAHFWSSTESFTIHAHILGIPAGRSAFVSSSDKSDASSVRCLQDSN